jgi:hypothetical protein
MARVTLLAVVAAGVLLVSGAAQAKAPATGVVVCGSTGCVSLAAGQAEMFWRQVASSGRPVAPGAFYSFRWHFDGEPDRTAYFVPDRRAVRWDGPQGWGSLEPLVVDAIKRSLANVEPFTSPALTRVTVGGRAVAAPQTYLALLGGKPTWIWPAGSWLGVKLTSPTPTPWTNGAVTIRLNRQLPYVVVDGWVFRIPKDVAVRARRGLALRG